MAVTNWTRRSTKLVKLQLIAKQDSGLKGPLSADHDARQGPPSEGFQAVLHTHTLTRVQQGAAVLPYRAVSMVAHSSAFGTQARDAPGRREGVHCLPWQLGEETRRHRPGPIHKSRAHQNGPWLQHRRHLLPERARSMAEKGHLGSGAAGHHNSSSGGHASWRLAAALRTTRGELVRTPQMPAGGYEHSAGPAPRR